MKRSLLYILLCAISPVMLAQSMQRGVVLEYNEKNEKTPLANVEIVVANAGSTVTDANGEFQLRFRQLKPGDRVQVRRIAKTNYEIFNQEVLDQWRISADDIPFTIILCRSDRLNETRSNMIRTATKSFERKYDYDVKQITIQYKKGNISKEEYENKANELRDEYQRRLENLDEYIDRFARIDLSSLNSVEAQVVKLVRDGKFDEAIDLYDKEDLVNKLVSQSESITDLRLDADKLKVAASQIAQQRDSISRMVHRHIDLLQLQGGAENAMRVHSILHDVAFSDTTYTPAMYEYAESSASLSMHEEALSIYESLSSTARACNDLVALAKAQIHKGAILNISQRYSECLPVLRDALLSLDSLRLLETDTLRYLETISYGCRYLGQNLISLHQADEGRLWILKGINSLRLLRSEPRFRDLEADYATILLQGGGALRMAGHLDESEAFIREGLEYIERLYSHKPYRYIALLAYGWSRLADVYYMLGDAYNDKCEECFLMADSYYRTAVERNPRAYERFKVTNMHNLGDFYKSQGDFDKALKCYEDGRILWERTAGQSAFSHRSLGETYSDIGECLYKLGRFAEALPYDIKSYEMTKPRYEAEPVVFRDQMGTCLLHLANTYNSMGQYKEAYEYVLKAMSVDPSYPETRLRLEELRTKLNLK